MKAYQQLWALMRYRPILYIINTLFWLVIHLAPLIPGLLAQQFFNRLYKVGFLDNILWLLIASFVMVALGRVVLILLGGWIDTLHRFSTSALLRRNLLQRIMERPGARPVPQSPGDALSRMRNDASTLEDTVSWTLDSIGKSVFTLVSIIILLRISVPITLLSFYH